MSNSLAIAAVSETLRKLLDTAINADPSVDPSSDPELAGTSVTVAPPDRARTNISGRQLNLFLYQTAINAAWRNQDMPRQVRSGESGRPPLPLNLHFFITAYAPDDDEVLAQRLLGRAMSILHDHPILDPVLIQNALEDNDLYLQTEHIRLTPHPLTLEEMSKLWSIFQTQYRLSAAYLATVVLIESTRPNRIPLPVLRIGADDRGPVVFTDFWPVLNRLYGLWQLPIQPPPGGGASRKSIRPAGDAPIARLGETLVVEGQSIGPIDTSACFSHPLMSAGIELPVQPGDTAQQVKINLPVDDPTINPGVLEHWPCGFYRVCLITQRNGISITSNEIPFLLSPKVTATPLNAGAGPVTLTVTCRPRVRPEQESKVYLLDGSRQIVPAVISTPADEDQPTYLTFQLNFAAADAGIHTLRLRVDGVDSLPFAVSAANGTMIYDPEQQLTIS